jgi:tetratricopeptide (TPR) repeat protein
MLMSVSVRQEQSKLALSALVRRMGALSAICFAGVLSACNTVPDSEAVIAEPILPVEVKREIIPTSKPELLPTAGLDDNERLSHAIALLEVGRSSQAKVELQAYLGVAPDSAVAQRLLFQIDAPLDSLFPKESFSVQLEDKETLSSLSGRYLGEVLSFYSLARYNEIINPSQVKVGQTIRIPATESALAAKQVFEDARVAEAEPVSEEEVTPWQIIEDHIKAGRYGAAIRDAEANDIMPEGNDAATLARAYEGIAHELEETATLLAGTRALRAGQLYLEAEQPRDALEMFELALEKTPGSTVARAFRDEARRELVDQEYWEGLRAFQRRQLDAAIAHFDRALEIDPGHRNANINRAQALELQSTTR